MLNYDLVVSSYSYRIFTLEELIKKYGDFCDIEKPSWVEEMNSFSGKVLTKEEEKEFFRARKAEDYLLLKDEDTQRSYYFNYKWIKKIDENVQLELDFSAS